MSKLLKLEEVSVFLLCLYLFSLLDFSWWWFPALLLLPDIGMIGYALNPKIGAYTYNLLHHRLTASAVAAYAMYTDNPWWQLAGIILFAHLSFDRAMGYGLKYLDAFQHTHLGTIGHKK